MAVSGVELKNGWPNVRAGRTVAMFSLVRREEEQPCRLFRILIGWWRTFLIFFHMLFEVECGVKCCTDP